MPAIRVICDAFKYDRSSAGSEEESVCSLALGGPVNDGWPRIAATRRLRNDVRAQQLQARTTNETTRPDRRRYVDLNSSRTHTPTEIRYLESLIPTPVIKHIQPNEGWIVGGQVVLILGENFFDGLQVMFNTMVVYSEVRRRGMIIEMEVTRRSANRFSHPELFEYTHRLVTDREWSMSRSHTKENSSAENVRAVSPISVSHIDGNCIRENIAHARLAMQDPTIDYSLQRLSKLIPKHADDPDRLSKVSIAPPLTLLTFPSVV